MKRIINIFVLLCMVVFMMSGVAWANNLAISWTKDGQSGSGTNDGSSQIVATSSSGDVTITGTVSTSQIDFITAQYGSNVTLKNVNITASQGAAIYVYGGTLNIESGTITGGSGHALAFVAASGTLNMYGGTLGGDNVKLALSVKDSGVANINGGTVTGCQTVIRSDSNINVKGGTITSTSNEYCVAWARNGGTITVSGGTITPTGGSGLVATANSHAVVTGGTVNAGSSSYAVLAHEGNAEAKISGGTINGPVGAGSSNNGANNKLEISGGVVDGKVYQTQSKGEVSISKGQFKKVNGQTSGDIEAFATNEAKNKIREDDNYIYVDIAETPAPSTDSNSGGGGGGGSAPEEEKPTVQEKNEDAITNVDIQPVDDTPEAQQALDDAKDAAIKALEKAETDVELTQDEVVALVQNQMDIAQDLETEQNNGGVVEDTKVPAASDLPVDDSIKVVNDLSATPKVTEPETPTPEEHAAIEEKLSNLDNLEDVEEKDKADIPQDFDVAQLINTNNKGDDGKELITIEKASNTLEAQASLINELFEEIKDFMTTSITGNGGDEAQHGVVLATRMPPMTPHISGWFPLKINMRHLVPGQRPRFWINPAAFRNAAGDANAAQVAAELSATEGDAFFLDGDGNPTTTIKGDASKMVVVAYLENEKTYDSAFITVDATEKDKAALEDMLAAEQESGDGNDDVNNSSSGGGGCEVGLGLGALLSLAIIAFKKR